MMKRIFVVPAMLAVLNLCACGGGSAKVTPTPPVQPTLPTYTQNVTTTSDWMETQQLSDGAIKYIATEIEPYFATDTTTDADNTRINVRDRQDQTLTPLNQGNSKADVATTAQIRKEILAAKNMSVNAQNVKIITIDGQVTLRGPVNTAEEKRLIREIADRSTHSGDVDNQLEVQPTPVSDK